MNAIAPGFTDTEASRSLADVDQYDTSKTPLKRLGTPEDITGAALFLASTESDFITGQTLLVDGGRYMHRILNVEDCAIKAKSSGASLMLS